MTQPGGTPAHLADAVRAVSLQVDRDTVLQARAAILAEARALATAVWEQRQQEGVGLCSADPLSPQASAAFNARIQTLYGQCGQYADELKLAGHALDEVAQRYGFTEEEIAASFRGSGG